MDTTLFSLSEIDINQTVEIKKILNEGTIKRRLLDLGFTENTKVKCLYKNSKGNFISYLIRDTIIALRDKDANGILCITDEFSLSLQKQADRSLL